MDAADGCAVCFFLFISYTRAIVGVSNRFASGIKIVAKTAQTGQITFVLPAREKC
jgi:hypothetical protein